MCTLGLSPWIATAVIFADSRVLDHYTKPKDSQSKSPGESQQTLTSSVKRFQRNAVVVQRTQYAKAVLGTLRVTVRSLLRLFMLLGEIMCAACTRRLSVQPCMTFLVAISAPEPSPLCGMLALRPSVLPFTLLAGP